MIDFGVVLVCLAVLGMGSRGVFRTVALRRKRVYAHHWEGGDTKGKRCGDEGAEPAHDVVKYVAKALKIK
jgi:hypothetical protein